MLRLNNQVSNSCYCIFHHNETKSINLDCLKTVEGHPNHDPIPTWPVACPGLAHPLRGRIHFAHLLV